MSVPAPELAVAHQAQQMVLGPPGGLSPLSFGAPRMVWRACGRNGPPQAKRVKTLTRVQWEPPRAPRPRKPEMVSFGGRRRASRWVQGTQPVVRLPLAGRAAKQRRYRDGRKPGSIGQGRLNDFEREEFDIIEAELLREGVYDEVPINIPDDCPPDEEPCPWMRCKFNLYADVIPSRTPGAPPIIKLNFPGKDIDEIGETCANRKALAAEENGGMTLEEVGKANNLTMGRTDQIVQRAVAKLAELADAQGWGERFRKAMATRRAKLPAEPKARAL